VFNRAHYYARLHHKPDDGGKIGSIIVFAECLKDGAICQKVVFAENIVMEW